MDFIFAERWGKDFLDWSWADIAYEVVTASSANELHVIQDQGEIKGIIIASINIAQKTCHVKHVLRSKGFGSRAFIATCKHLISQVAPDCVFTGKRAGILRSYKWTTRFN